MISYREAKEAMKERGLCTDHFSLVFYRTYVADLLSAQECYDKGKETFQNTKATDFYRENGSSYCHFLEMVYASLPLFRITFRAGGWDGPVISSSEERFLDYAAAENFARRKKTRLFRCLRESFSKGPDDICYSIELQNTGEGV